MNIDLLKQAILEFKNNLEDSIRTSTFNGNIYNNGAQAKEALIRSQKLINLIHEVIKKSIDEQLQSKGREHKIYPPINSSGPELSITGLIKQKKQDVVVLFDKDEPTSENILDGPLKDQIDVVGKKQSERSLIIGIRSQMSSIAKNFDTLMERTFAETLNLRLRLPKLVMGEVYLLPVKEYDDVQMKNNQVSWKQRPISIEKFIKIFLEFSGRTKDDDEYYKYERSTLVFVDFSQNPPKLYLNIDELRNDGLISNSSSLNYNSLSPLNFVEDLLKAHKKRHKKCFI